MSEPVWRERDIEIATELCFLSYYCIDDRVKNIYFEDGGLEDIERELSKVSA